MYQQHREREHLTWLKGRGSYTRQFYCSCTEICMSKMLSNWRYYFYMHAEALNLLLILNTIPSIHWNIWRSTIKFQKHYTSSSTHWTFHALQALYSRCSEADMMIINLCSNKDELVLQQGSAEVVGSDCGTLTHAAGVPCLGTLPTDCAQCMTNASATGSPVILAPPMASTHPQCPFDAPVSGMNLEDCNSRDFLWDFGLQSHDVDMVDWKEWWIVPNRSYCHCTEGMCLSNAVCSLNLVVSGCYFEVRTVLAAPFDIYIYVCVYGNGRIALSLFIDLNLGFIWNFTVVGGRSTVPL